MFERQSQQLMSGGINLVASPDLVPHEQASQSKNIAYDQEGALKSRLGSVQLFTAAGPVLDMITALGSRYQLAGGQLCQEGSVVGTAGASTKIAAFQKH